MWGCDRCPGLLSVSVLKVNADSSDSHCFCEYLLVLILVNTNIFTWQVKYVYFKVTLRSQAELLCVYKVARVSALSDVERCEVFSAVEGRSDVVGLKLLLPRGWWVGLGS